MSLLQRLCGSALVLLLSMASLAEAQGNLKPYPVEKRNVLLEYAPNFTVEKYLSLRNSDRPEDRRYAEFFMLGVVEATEGKSWCGYSFLKTISIVDWIESFLSKLDKASLINQGSTSARLMSSQRVHMYPDFAR